MSSRQQAIAAGASTYFTGEPCKHGHIAPRYTSTRQCSECSKAKGQAHYHAKGKHTAKFRHIMNKYSLSREAFEQLLEQQRGCCAICGCDLCVNGGNGHDELAVDHDHATGEIRGLLCNHCNRGLGMFRDNPELLRQAAAYLERK